MPDFSAEAFCTYVVEENKAARGVYDDLCSAYQTSLSTYPQELNLLGVYFFDILKLLTLSQLKTIEITQRVAPTHSCVTRSLERWPYLGYDDVKNGCDLASKRYGKGTSIGQRRLKTFLQFIINSRYLLGQRVSARISLLSPMVDSGANLWLRAPDIRSNLINIGSGWFSLPQLGDQLALLESLVCEVVASNEQLLPAELMVSLLRRHILSDCTEGTSHLKVDGDLLLLKSGVELQNRMLSVTAMQQGIPVVNIMHGEAFGVYDEPIFSKYGEQMYSSAILGYGSGVLSSSSSYQYGMRNGTKYIESNGVDVLRHYKPEFLGVKPAGRKINYFYFPTSLGGASHRYGPFRDAPDMLYFGWQKKLLSLFGSDIKIKAHPKERYGESYPSFGVEIVEVGLDEVLNDIDVFVFDYISTAFNIACATDKPIVYFDLGVRNIHKDAMEMIKKRTIYFNIKNGVPSREEIEGRLRFSGEENKYSRVYSLAGGSENRAASLATGIKQLLSR